MNTEVSSISTPESVLRGPKICLLGDGGTGKTYALGTLVDWAEKHGKTVHVLFTDQGLETLLGYWTDRGKPVPKCLSWMEVIPRPLSPEQLLDMAQKVGKLSYKSLTELTDGERGKTNAHEAILKALINFKDDRTGQEFGSVMKWGVDKIFAIDNLTECAEAIIKMTIGAKPTMAPPEYGVAQNNLMNFIRTYASGEYTFVLIAHVSREKDELTGGIRLMIKAIGTAISGDISKPFSDAIYTVREADRWYWDTANSAVATKTRNLPVASKISPDFAQIMDKWVSRGGR